MGTDPTSGDAQSGPRGARVLPALLVAEALLVASPLATVDNLLTSPRAVGAQARRADLAATVASGLPFVVAMLPVAMVAVAVAARRGTRGSRVGAVLVSVAALAVALLPGQRGMTTAAPVLHGALLAVVAVAALVVVVRARGGARGVRRSRAGRVTVAAATLWLVLLAGIGATSTTIPTSPLARVLSPDLELDTTVPEGPLDTRDSAQHPFLAPNPDSNIHGDAAMTDAYTDRQVTDPQEARVLSRHLGGVCASMLFDSRGRVVATCVSATRVTLNVLDPDTLEPLAREHVADRPFRIDFATNFTGGGYAVLDDEERVVLPTADGRITRWSVADASGAAAIEPVDEFDVSDSLADGEAINSVVPAVDGSLWIVGNLGTVALLDTDEDSVESMRFPDADIENSFAVGDDGRAWVVTSRELVALESADGTPRVVWRQAYDTGTRRKPGQTSRASGTTPTLMVGEGRVAITDNAEPRMNVVVYDTSEDAHEEERELCRVPVFGKGRSATDNSLIAIGDSLFVENNYGYSLFDATFGRSVEPGMTRIDVSEDGCETVWTNDEVRIPSVVSKGTADGVIATYTKSRSVAGVDAWYFTAVDATTGEVMWRRLAGTGPMANNHYAAIYVGPDGALYVGATGGLIALVPKGR